MIIQYDPPKTEDSYIHKAGRTARGTAIVNLLELDKDETITAITADTQGLTQAQKERKRCSAPTAFAKNREHFFDQ